MVYAYTQSVKKLHSSYIEDLPSKTPVSFKYLVLVGASDWLRLVELDQTITPQPVPPNTFDGYW